MSLKALGCLPTTIKNGFQPKFYSTKGTFIFSIIIHNELNALCCSAYKQIHEEMTGEKRK